MKRLGPLLLAACATNGQPPTEPPTKPVTAPAPASTPSPKPEAELDPEPEPEPAIGCWETQFGSPPAAEGLGPSLDAPLDGCEGCEQLTIGPNAKGLHAEVLKRLKEIADGLPPPPISEPVLWVNSGKRDGHKSKSMHNQGLAIDVVICGQDTRGSAEALRDAGFTCVIEYYDPEDRPCHFAHGDMRGTKWAKGAYAKDGRKAGTCPERAVSKSEDCQNKNKADWSYRKP